MIANRELPDPELLYVYTWLTRKRAFGPIQHLPCDRYSDTAQTLFSSRRLTFQGDVIPKTAEPPIPMGQALCGRMDSAQGRRGIAHVQVLVLYNETEDEHVIKPTWEGASTVVSTGLHMNARSACTAAHG